MPSGSSQRCSIMLFHAYPWRSLSPKASRRPTLFFVPFSRTPGYALNTLSELSPRIHFSNSNQAGSGQAFACLVFLSRTGRPLASKIPSSVINSSVIPLYCLTVGLTNCTKSVSLEITICSSVGCKAIQRAIISSASA